MEKLEYRRDLKVNKKILLGTELEVAGFDILKNIRKNTFDNFSLPYQINRDYEILKRSKYTKWLFTEDVTTMGEGDAVEVISPISTLNVKFLDELCYVCQFLERYDGFINKYCGAHVHIDFRIFHQNLKALKKFILIMSYYEPELNRFFAGEQETLREGANIYARNITRSLYNLEKYYEIFQLEEELFINRIKDLGRNYSLNFAHASILKTQNRNTVELRSPNGSLNPVVLENNIYTLLKIVEYCFCNSDWHDLYFQWKELEGQGNRLPELAKARTLSRTIFTSKEDLKYFDWQYEKAA